MTYLDPTPPTEIIDLDSVNPFELSQMVEGQISEAVHRSNLVVAAAAILADAQETFTNTPHLFCSPEGYLFAVWPQDEGLIPSEVVAIEVDHSFIELNAVQDDPGRMKTSGRFLANLLEIVDHGRLEATHLPTGTVQAVKPSSTGFYGVSVVPIPHMQEDQEI